MGTILVVLVFVLQPDKSLRIVQEIPVKEKAVCLAMVEKINMDRTHPFVAACYSDIKVGGA